MQKIKKKRSNLKCSTGGGHGTRNHIFNNDGQHYISFLIKQFCTMIGKSIITPIIEKGRYSAPPPVDHPQYGKAAAALYNTIYANLKLEQ
ncbi:MAG: hypothetical protein AB9836_12220 [Aminipila sp.]